VNEPLIDPATAGDQAMCKPEALLGEAGKLTSELLPELEAVKARLLDLSPAAPGSWDIAKGYGDTVHRARVATGESLQFVLEQVQRVIDDLAATANTVRDADQRAADAAPRTNTAG
jgi:hypothetical protein